MMTFADDVEDVITVRRTPRLYFRHAQKGTILECLGDWLSYLPQSVF
jgi:hypothetical protein